MSLASHHRWHFVRLGGLDQALIRTGDDLRALPQLDQKLWVALSCPVAGLEIDQRTLELIDADQDGRIRVPDLLAILQQADEQLQDLGELLQGDDRLPLRTLRTDSPAGTVLHSAAQAIAATPAQAEQPFVSLSEVVAARRVFGSRPLNGDGIITPDSTEDAELKRTITDIVSCLGGQSDRSGKPGINRERVEQFFAAAQDYLGWAAQGAQPSVLTLDAATGAAAAAVAAVRAKVDDFFARVRLTEYDPRAADSLNASIAGYAAWSDQELTLAAPEISALPLAPIGESGALPLRQGVNPAWAGALVTLHEAAVTPLFGASTRTLTEAQWTELKARVAPYEAWQAAKAGAVVEPLGVERLRLLLNNPSRPRIETLIEQDLAQAPEHDALETLERLCRLRRDLSLLLRNFLNFADFYSRERLAIFQKGVLFLDSRSFELCIEVTDPAAHAKLAALSQIYLAYCELKRAGEAARKIVVGVTEGDGDYLRVGRNGVFYDRQGRDWDATITLIIENPISLWQAFWSPYKRVARFVEDQMTKFAAAKEKSADQSLAAGIVQTTTASPGAVRPGFDVAKFAGIFAAIGLALGAIGGAMASVATGLMRLTWWQMPLAVGAALLLISGPSLALAGLKLRRRTLGPVLDACGWAINGRVHINIPFGTTLTKRALLPRHASRSLDDPYADRAARRRKTVWLVLVLLALGALLSSRWLHTWPFKPPVPPAPAPAQGIE